MQCIKTLLMSLELKKKSQNESKSLFLNSAIVSFKPSLKAFIINPLLYIKHESLDLFTVSIESTENFYLTLTFILSDETYESYDMIHIGCTLGVIRSFEKKSINFFKTFYY